MTITPATGNGFAAKHAAHLAEHAKTIIDELQQINRLFQDELIPRCTKVGDALQKARGFFTDSDAFYQWAESTVGIKQRQVRTYIRFASKLNAITGAAEEQNVQLTSMEQGLALLAPVKEEVDQDTESYRIQQMVAAVGRAKGAISRAVEAICEFRPAGINPEQQAVLENARRILESWADNSSNPGGVIDTNALAVNRQQADWSDDTPAAATSPTSEELEQRLDRLDAQAAQLLAVPTEATEQQPSEETADLNRLVKAGLPVSEKPGKWTLAQFEEGLALCDDNQSRFARTIGVSKASISSSLKKKRAQAAPRPVDSVAA